VLVAVAVVIISNIKNHRVLDILLPTLLNTPDMSSSSSAHRLLLTKEMLRNYKYLQIISRYALQIRDTVCDDIEKGNISCDKQTKYAYKIDEQSTIHKSAVQVKLWRNVQDDVITELQKSFPDSKIAIQEKERMDGFVVTKSTYIEIDWS